MGVDQAAGCCRVLSCGVSDVCMDQALLHQHWHCAEAVTESSTLPCVQSCWLSFKTCCQLY